ALHPDTVRLLRSMSERAVLGVRGEYTASVLERLGVINLRIIGCPSMYYGMKGDFRLDRPVFHAGMRPVANFRTFYGRLDPAECEFLTWAANKGLPFVEQTQQLLELSHCQNNQAQFDYLSAWLREKMQVFFHVEDWCEWIRRYDFSIGSRFHGNVIAVMNGVPALTLVCDPRMDEMTRLFRLPTLRMDEFSMDKPIEHYYELADFTEFNRVYPERIAAFRDFLRRNHLTEAIT
ncbi:MAG: polysaccharide pyruvyl transferase family protein, partial [Clostridia bacterium]|nr:polysaccharide pyruvyl transferase family protein [Clostridia bacterium]